MAKLLRGRATVSGDATQVELDLKANIASPAFTGTPTGIVRGSLEADIIDGTKLADNAIDSEHYTDGSIDLAHMSADSVDSDQYVDGSIDNAHIADDAVGVAELSATGTASSSTFLRGDNAWATAGGGALTKIGSASFSDVALFDVDQDLGSYKRHKWFLTIGNDGGTAATSYFKLVVKIGGSILHGTSYSGSRWWSKQDATSVSCDANSATSSFTFTPSEGAPFLYGSGATNITAFASYEFTFSNFVESGNDNYSYLWYSGIGSNHDSGSPMFTTKGACTIMNTGTVEDIQIYSDTNRTMKGDWVLYGISN